MPAAPTSPTARTHKAETRQLRKLLAEHDPQMLEEGLVRRHLSNRRSSTVRNHEIQRIAGDRCDTAVAIDEHLSACEAGSLDDLIHRFEALVPTPEGTSGTRNPDAVFTPGWVGEMLTGEAITATRRNGNVMDPSCGCGALLAAAFRRIWDLHSDTQTPQLAKHIIDTQLHGVDIDADNIRRAKLVLTLAAIDVGADNPNYTFANLTTADSLDPDTWHDTGDVTGGDRGGDRDSGTRNGQRFDVVIGNPPYIRYHQLNEAQRNDYRNRFDVLSEGNFNVYYAFFELAHRLRTDDGVIAYITPNAYFRATSARPLRRWMASARFPTKIVDFGCAKVFTEASTYERCSEVQAVVGFPGIPPVCGRH